jgi:hypothetical protein
VAFLFCLIWALVVLLQCGQRKKHEWDINWAELEVGEELGMGGHGEVFKAKWRGTEVAVKMLAGNVTVTKEMQRCFTDEVNVHP